MLQFQPCSEAHFLQTLAAVGLRRGGRPILFSLNFDYHPCLLPRDKMTKKTFKTFEFIDQCHWHCFAHKIKWKQSRCAWTAVHESSEYPKEKNARNGTLLLQGTAQAQLHGTLSPNPAIAGCAIKGALLVSCICLPKSSLWVLCTNCNRIQCCSHWDVGSVELFGINHCVCVCVCVCV